MTSASCEIPCHSVSFVCIYRINCIFNPSESFRSKCIKKAEQESVNELLQIHTPPKKQNMGEKLQSVHPISFHLGYIQ